MISQNNVMGALGVKGTKEGEKAQMTYISSAQQALGSEYV